MRGKAADKVRLSHILDAITEIERYLIGATYADFAQNSMMRFACIKQLEIIGEACNRISPETKAKNTQIKWGQIVGLRNMLIHEYFGVDVALVWQIIQHDLPELKLEIVQLLNQPE